jgi:hypothetical protein
MPNTFVMKKYLLFAVLALFMPFLALAQESDKAFEMAEVLHQNGKIYLVVLVLLTIFAGVLTMLIRLERKLSRWEAEKETVIKH